MSWRKIPMKFPGNCIICNEKIYVNEIGLWAKGLGVKHEKCAETKELKCIICGNSAGCQHCEFYENCDLSQISQNCICKVCEGKSDLFKLYKESVKQSFPALDLNI